MTDEETASKLLTSSHTEGKYYAFGFSPFGFQFARLPIFLRYFLMFAVGVVTKLSVRKCRHTGREHKISTDIRNFGKISKVSD